MTSNMTLIDTNDRWLLKLQVNSRRTPILPIGIRFSIEFSHNPCTHIATQHTRMESESSRVSSAALKGSLLQSESFSSSDGVYGAFEDKFTRWFGQDPDDVCAYSTPKIVRIRSWQLGLTANCLTLIIFFGYIVGYTIIYNQGFLKYQNVKNGNVQASIFSQRQPVVPSYCCDCSVDSGEPRDNSTCPISGYNTQDGYIEQTGKSCCYFATTNTSSMPIRFARNTPTSLSFVTRYNHLVTSTACPASPTPSDKLNFAVDPSCVQSEQKSAIPYFIAGIENFTIGLSHGIAVKGGGNVLSVKVHCTPCTLLLVLICALCEGTVHPMHFTTSTHLCSL
jgi:hypothetical protein